MINRSEKKNIPDSHICCCVETNEGLRATKPRAGSSRFTDVADKNMSFSSSADKEFMDENMEKTENENEVNHSPNTNPRVGDCSSQGNRIIVVSLVCYRLTV